jgi:hypothetical protein
MDESRNAHIAVVVNNLKVTVLLASVASDFNSEAFKKNLGYSQHK